MRDDWLEALALFELLDRADRHRVLQTNLRSRDHQRLPEVPQHLPSQYVEVVGRHGRLSEAEVDVEGIELVVSILVTRIVNIRIQVLQKSLDMASGMFRAGSIKTMGQEENEARLPEPLQLTAHHVLVHDHLRWVVKVAKLCLPEAKVLRGLKRVPILIGHCRDFAEICVGDLKAADAIRCLALPSIQITLERIAPLSMVLLIMKNEMPLREGASLGVFADQP